MSFPKLRSACVLLLCAVLSVPAASQEVRLPVNYFELLPPEAMFLVKGEGLLSFDYLGHYTFVTQHDSASIYRRVEVVARMDSVHVMQVWNQDTTHVEWAQRASGEFVLSYWRSTNEKEVISSKQSGDSLLVSYRGEVKYVYADNHWHSRVPDIDLSAIFGSSRLQNALYAVAVQDKQGLTGRFRRRIDFGDRVRLDIIERSSFRRFRLKRGEETVLTRGSGEINVSLPYRLLSMPEPPLIANEYSCVLKLREIPGGMELYYEKE